MISPGVDFGSQLILASQTFQMVKCCCCWIPPSPAFLVLPQCCSAPTAQIPFRGSCWGVSQFPVWPLLPWQGWCWPPVHTELHLVGAGIFLPTYCFMGVNSWIISLSAGNAKFRPTTAAEVLLKDVFFNFFFYFLKDKQSKTQWETRRMCAHPTELNMWNLVNSSKLVNKCSSSLDSSVPQWGLGCFSLSGWEGTNNFPPRLHLAICSDNEPQSMSHLLTKSRVNKFIFKTQLLQNALRSDCLVYAESPMSSWLVGQLK